MYNSCFSRIKIIALPIIFCLALAGSSPAQDKPATTAAAAANLDLRSFPVPDKAVVYQPRRLANLRYLTEAKSTEAFAWSKASLLNAGWTELPGGYSSDEYANGSFSKNGFLLSLSASPSSGDGSAKGTDVTLTQHGNIDFEKLPRPTDLKEIYAGPVSVIYVTDASVEVATTKCTEALTNEGWIPYSNPVQPLYFKRHAVRLSVYIVTAPAQQNKTSVSYSAELMSVELDPPPQCTRIHYADTTTALHFDSELSIDDVFKFYREHLGSSGWKATLDKPVKISLYDTMIFRNAAHDMLTLELSAVDGISRGSLAHETAAEVAASEKAIEEIARQKVEAEEQMKRARAANKIAIPFPAEASEVEIADERIEFQLPSGKSATPIKSLRKFFVDAGWTEEVVTDEANARVFTYKLKEARIELMCVDPGFIPAEITLSSRGVTLETK